MSLPLGLEMGPFDQPVIVVALAEFPERLGDFLQCFEVAHLDEMFFEGAKEAFDTAVPLTPGSPAARVGAAGSVFAMVSPYRNSVSHEIVRRRRTKTNEVQRFFTDANASIESATGVTHAAERPNP